MLKTNAKLIFSLLGYFSNVKNVCSKQAEGYFLIYQAKFIKLLLYMFKASGELIFSLLGYYD